MQVFLQFILSVVYTYSSGLSWAVLSYPSSNPQNNSLNVASPSLSSEYWISTFTAGERPVFVGSFPPWAEYSSLSAYDDRGVLIDGSTVNSFQNSNGTIDLLAGVDNSQLSRPYAVIHRVYRPANRTECLQDNEKFKVLSGSEVPQPTATESQARDNGKRLEPELQKTLGKIHADLRPNRDLYKPSSRTMPGLFPNSDAIYLVSSPSRKTTGMRVSGCFVDSTESTSVKYLGYTTTDMYTTATHASYEVLRGGCYDIFVMKGLVDPSEYGYDPGNSSQSVIYWNVGAIFPTLVLRIVDVSCSLGQCSYVLNQSRYVPPAECRAALGRIYPGQLRFL